MSNYLFIQSQDPFTDVGATFQYELMLQLSRAGKSVSVVLVQNGVTAARNGAPARHFDHLCANGLSIYADDFSLAQREITIDQLKPGIQPVSIDIIIESLLAGDKVIWN